MTSSESKIRQFQHESDTWKRALEFIIGENVALKTRLAEILSGKQVTREFLERAEKYQNDFTREDEMVRLLRYDISKLDKLLFKDQYLDGKSVAEEIISKQKNLSREVENITKEFSRLKFDFNNYMAEIL